MIDFPIYVEYTQILVHTESHPSPGLIWTHDHVAQGFAWSDGLVSFGVPDHDGPCQIKIMFDDDYDSPHSKALWAIQTPFSVSEPLEIGTVFDTKLIEIPTGNYNLIFEIHAGLDEFAYSINLIFLQVEKSEFAILRAGPGLTSDVILRTDAEIAN